MTDIATTNFVRKPFNVEAVEITDENIADLAEFIGTLKHKDNGQPYIHVDRRLVPNIYKVFPGFWMTKMGDNIRCYSRKIFLEQFVETTPEIQGWVNFLNEENEITEAVEPVEELPQVEVVEPDEDDVVMRPTDG